MISYTRWKVRPFLPKYRSFPRIPPDIIGQRIASNHSIPNTRQRTIPRLIMGASPSGEYFHEIIHNLIKHIPNCQNISDNIWLWSKDITEHAKQLDMLLQTIEDSGLTLKFPKCSFAVPEINVFGHVVSWQRNPARQEESRSSGQRTSSQNISRSTLVPWPC